MGSFYSIDKDEGQHSVKLNFYTPKSKKASLVRTIPPNRAGS